MNKNSVLEKKKSITLVMLEVIIALIPAIICMVYFYGKSYVFHLINSAAFAIVSEAVFFYLKGYEYNKILFRIKDCSALLTAFLLALSMPPDIPWYLVSIGSMFAVVIAKQLYGGLGQNIFNPAMVGYCVLLISFPAIFTSWPMSKNINEEPSYDSISSATPLETIKSQTKNNQTISYIKNSNPEIFSTWMIINISYLIGGVYLIIRKIIRFTPSATFLSSIALLSYIFSIINPDIYPGIYVNLFSGATMIAAFFIITDPVTMPANKTSQIIYAFGIALFTYVIRTFAGYPDGVAFSVLLMNATVPLLDKINIPKPFGVR